MSYKPPYNLTTKIVNLISLISEEITKVEYSNQKITPKLRKINRIKTLSSTLAIEGNFLGEEKITAILEGKRVLGKYDEILEAKGAINAYKGLEDYRFDNIDDLLKAHKIMMSDIICDAGELRNINVAVGNHIAPPFKVVPTLMSDLFEWLKNSEEHPLISSSIFHYEFEFIHPFSDGNGRVGRLWQSVILYSYKSVFNLIPIESIIKDNQDNYYQAIENSNDLGKSTPFIEFMLEIILEAIQSSVKGSVKSSVKDKILEYVKQNPTITIKELSEILELSTRAIEKQMANLKKDNMLKRVGSARKGHWEII